MTITYVGYPPDRVKQAMLNKTPSQDGTPVFTYNVGVNGDLELDFGPSMANKEVGLEIEEA